MKTIYRLMVAGSFALVLIAPASSVFAGSCDPSQCASVCQVVCPPGCTEPCDEICPIPCAPKAECKMACLQVGGGATAPSVGSAFGSLDRVEMLFASDVSGEVVK